jgi:hypothetical protein
MKSYLLPWSLGTLPQSGLRSDSSIENSTRGTTAFGRRSCLAASAPRFITQVLFGAPTRTYLINALRRITADAR